MKNDNENRKANKLSIYPEQGMRNRIDRAYGEYVEELQGQGGLPVRPVSKSAWILTLLSLSPALNEPVGQ